MKRMALLLLLALILPALSAGCALDPFKNRDFRSEGFDLWSVWGEYHYDANKQKATMIIHNGLHTVEMVDRDMDDKVDHVEYRWEDYERYEEGTEEIFAEADDNWLAYGEKMGVAANFDIWAHMNASDFARHDGYFKCDTDGSGE